MRSWLIGSLVLGAAMLPATAQSQAAPQQSATAGAGVTAGAVVYDTAGAEVGKIATAENGVVVIDTGTNKVPVPATNLGTSPKGPTLGMTKAQLDAAFAQARSQADDAVTAKLAAGAEVHGSGGTVVGTVKSSTDSAVVVTTSKGDAQLPRSAFALNGDALTIGLTAAQLEAAIGAAR